MKEISLIVFAILACSVYSLEDKFENDKQIFKEYLEETYESRTQLQLFIKKIWPDIQKSVPETVIFPNMEASDEFTEYLCLTEFPMEAKIGSIFVREIVKNTEENIMLAIEAELFLDKKPAKFGIAEKLDNGEASGIVPVIYSFKKTCRVKFYLEIPNFLGKRDIETPMCITKVKKIIVVRMKNPEPEMTIKGKIAMKVANDFERLFFNDNEYPGKLLATIGLTRAVNDWLHANENFWLCSSEMFDRVAETCKKYTKYSDDFIQYCLNGEKND